MLKVGQLHYLLRKLKLKPKWNYTTHLPEWPKWKKDWKSNDGKGVVQLEFLYIIPDSVDYRTM